MMQDSEIKKLDISKPQIVERVEYLDEDRGKKPEVGMALCLSGGGYRAMLFHAGVVWRLKELGFLPKLKRISSVLGGSITAGVLALYWENLGFDSKDVGQHFAEQIIVPIKNSLRPFEMIYALAKTPPRLQKLDSAKQERIINWGYAICDASIRKCFDEKLSPPKHFPFPSRCRRMINLLNGSL